MIVARRNNWQYLFFPLHPFVPCTPILEQSAGALRGVWSFDAGADSGGGANYCHQQGQSWSPGAEIPRRSEGYREGRLLELDLVVSLAFR